MIQTQLLRLEPPYQIIANGGEVALHVATLIVTQEKTDAKGRTRIETHCRPVVNYSRKEFFAESPQWLERHHSDDESPAARTPHPSAEGTIWDQADVAHVNVLGIAGVTTELSWKALTSNISESKNTDEFKYRLRRNMACLRDLAISVKRCESDPAIFFVDINKMNTKQLWTDVFFDGQVIFSAAVKTMKAAQEAWIEVIRVLRKFLIGENTLVSFRSAPWKEGKDGEALQKLASEADNILDLGKK